MDTQFDQSIKEAISARSREFEAAYCAGDAARLVQGYFTSDALEPCAFPPGGSPPVRGRSAMIKMFDGMFAVMPAIRLELVELRGSGKIAFEVGRSHLSSQDGSAVTGRYTVCWIEENGDWRANIDFFAEDGWHE